MKKYSIGLDIGTTSVGWVCISPEYEILKFNNRLAFGVHEFEGAKVAEGRRMQRGKKRRYNRRKKRIQLIQQMFQKSMNESFPGFFSKQNSLHFWRNDNQFENRTLSETLRSLKINTKSYPTMYHLRHDLIHSKEKADLRLIYLAIHNLTKYRGHFLIEGMKWTSKAASINITEQLELILKKYDELIQREKMPFSIEQLNRTEGLLLDNKTTRQDRNNQLKAILGKEYESLFKLLLGLKVSCDKLFPLSENLQLYKEMKKTLVISSEEFESEIEQLTDEEFEFIEYVIPFYQQLSLNNLLNGHSCVASAKVASFLQFEKDLENIKYIVNKYSGEKEYRDLFITPKRNQTAFSNSHDSNLLCLFDQYLKVKKSEDLFKSKIDKILQAASEKANDVDGELIQGIRTALSNEQFLVKQKGTQNASIPNQNNVYEAREILKNQQPYYSFMTDEWIKKIVQIISFRIPYYIGPLGDSQYSWVVRKNNENITPWNFNNSIDKAESAAQFIERMKNKCTYLKSESVLPKNSLLYQKYELLNELNSIQLRSPKEESNKKYRLEYDVKNWIIENVFKKYKVVTHAKIIQELQKSKFKDEIFLDDEVKVIVGTQKPDRFISNLSSYITFNELLPNESEETIEKIIYWLTVFNEKEIIQLKIKEFYPHITDKQIEKLCMLKLTGWGKLSNALLTQIPLNDAEDSVLEYMEKFSENFMEILSRTDLKKKIVQLNKEVSYSKTKIKYKDVQELAGSPALKRGIWRAIKIVEELTDIFGEPENIMIEIAREDQKSKSPKSNKKLWEELGKEWKDRELKDFHKKMSSYPEEKFKDRRFWLYVTQQGKCLYTGTPLDIEKLQLYDIDHILPRNFVKDDSIDNLALVIGDVNKNKNKFSNKMPLEIISEKNQYAMKSYWEQLSERRLISNKKYSLLLKPTFDNVEKEKFINRQLVETRQIIQNVKDLLQERFVETSIHLVKAGIVSKFRKSLELPKIRDYNNKHHAMDALLTVTLIQFIKQTYGQNFLEFNFKNKDLKKKWDLIIRESKDFFVFKDFKEAQFKSNIASKYLPSVVYMKEIYYRVPWQSTKMTGNTEKSFYKEMPLSPKANPKKEVLSESAKAVFDGIENESIWAIEYSIKKKNKVETKLELFDYRVIDAYIFNGQSNDEIAKQIVARNKNVKILSAKFIKELPKYQKILWNNHPCYLMSTGELQNAKQFSLTQELFEEFIKAELSDKSLEELKELFTAISECFFEQYSIYNTSNFRVKVEKFINEELINLFTFNKGVEELFKSAAANANRSDKFGSRLQKVAKASEIRIIDESITGLKYRKPQSIKKNPTKQPDNKELELKL